VLWKYTGESYERHDVETLLAMSLTIIGNAAGKT